MSTHFTWQSAVLDSGCESSTKLVLLAIGSFMNQHGTGAFPSLETLAAKTSLSKLTVRRHVQVAEEAGWLAVKKRYTRNGDKDSNLYSVRYPDEVGSPFTHVGSPVTQGGFTSNPQVGSPVTHNTPVLTHQVTPHKEERDLTAADLVKEGIPSDLADDFLKVRRKKKAPLTSRAWNAIKREAGKAGWSLEAAVEKCVERTWQTFDASWVAQKVQGTTLNKQEALEAKNRQVAMQLMAEFNGGKQ